MPSTGKSKRGNGSSGGATTTKRSTKKARVAAASLASLRSQNQQLLQEKEDMENRHAQERAELSLEAEEELSKYPDHKIWDHTCKKAQEAKEKYRQISDKRSRLRQDQLKRQEKEMSQWQERMDEWKPTQPLIHQETNPTIQAFCKFQAGGGILEKITDYLDPLSLFMLGRAVFVAVSPLTQESAPLLEGLKSSLLGRTCSPFLVELDNESLFQFPIRPTIYESQNRLIAYFHHGGPRTLWDKKIPNEYYESLGGIEQDGWGCQARRKYNAMNENQVYPGGDRHGCSYNNLLYGAYNFRGYGWSEEDPPFDDNNNNAVMKEMGAFAGNANAGPWKWWGNLLHDALVLAKHGRRSYVLLQDILAVVEQMNIKFSFPKEKMHPLSLLDGRTISATVTELAGFQSNFKDVKTVEPPAGTRPFFIESARMDATSEALWEHCNSFETIQSKAKATIEDHIAQGDEWLEEMTNHVWAEEDAFDCDNDDEEEYSDSDVEIQVLERLTEEEKTREEVQLITKKAEARQAAAKEELEAFVNGVIPSLAATATRPQFVGNGLMFLKACWRVFPEITAGPSFLSISASLFLQQLFEDVGLGTALQPIFWRAPLATGSGGEEPARRRSKRLASKEEGNNSPPPSFLIHLILCPNGTTIVSKHLHSSWEVRRDECKALELVTNDEDDADEDFTDVEDSEEGIDNDDVGP